MNLLDVMNELKQAGTLQNRKVYAKHGVESDMFGVSYAHLRKLAQKIKKDHALAQELWNTGNHDCRLLACMVAEPLLLEEHQINSWSADVKNYPLTDELANLFAKISNAWHYMSVWVRNDNEWIGRLGYKVAALLALQDESIPEQYFVDLVTKIEKTIHQQPNRKREAMNAALIAIGIRNQHLRFLAETAAERIGPVHVDHGETNCKTPDAIPYIEKAWQRKQKKT